MLTKIILALSIFAFSPVASAEITGLSIMQEQKQRHDVPQEFSQKKMTLESAKGKVKHRRMINYTRSLENQGNKTLLKFLEPTTIHNVGLLTWEQADPKEDDQWLYLPASKKIKRISGGGKSNSFMGTDFSFEDMRPENLQTHEYEILGEEDIDGLKYWLVQALPTTRKEKKASGYSKRIFWVRQDIYFTVKVEFYDRKKRLSKIGLYTDLEEVADGVWRSNVVSMENIKRKTRTSLITNQRDLVTPLSDAVFGTQALKRPPLKN
ncbi:MAG: outer membrane lipoprotein-sorting protein [Gammaproteobacteria bacterium]|nr:outer membrane lipoprotein-sorting protein [Gammaproteobacteria bacterium]